MGWSSEPCWADVRTSDISSLGERAELEFVGGFDPGIFEHPVGHPLVSRISRVNTAENSTCGPATNRAVDSGTATARYWATSSRTPSTPRWR